MDANDIFLHMLGLDQRDLAAGRLRLTAITPPEWTAHAAQTVQEVMRTGSLEPYENEYVHRDGSRVPVLIGAARIEGNGSKAKGISFVVDLTKRKQAEAQVRESERQLHEVQMELAHANRVATLGQLTASIAHEVKQPIAAAATNAQAGIRWLGTQPPNLDEGRQAFARIVQDIKHADAVIGRIRDVIKKAPPRKDAFEINEAIREVIALTHGEAAKSTISVETDLADGLPVIRGDRVQLQQVVLNLVINAVEAMKDVAENERQLVICTGKTEPDNIVVMVRDWGPGLDPAAFARLFGAFYTTKPDGLGLGLSICRSIVEAHGGRLWASDNSPRGATFQFTVPVEPP